MATHFPRLTRAGAILLAKAIAGNQLTFTRGAFGDANSSTLAPSDKQIDNLTSLINEKISLPISAFKIQNNQAIVTLLVKNEGLQVGFPILEGGLFAYNPDTDREILYAYFFDGDEADFMPAPDSFGMQLEYQYEFITAVSNATNVTAVIDKSTLSVMRDEFEAHITAADPHPNFDAVLHPEFYSHVQLFNAHLAAFNSHIESDNPHPNLPSASDKVRGLVKVGKNLYMEDDSLNAVASDASDLDARLKQIEINQANLYILLQSAFTLGDKANLQLVENFNPTSSCDFYEARVYSTPSKKYLRVFEPGHLRVGGHFTVTNGRLLQEQCRVYSFGKWGDYDTPFIANLKAPLDNEYPSSLTNYLYRSTVTIRDNKAYGAGEIIIRSQVRNKLWRGEGDSDSQQIQFNAYPSLESSFQLDGDWSLSPDGFFSLE